MKTINRNNGISVLIASQNEEAMIALCVLSFLDFGDEIIVVDNGSTDNTIPILMELQSKFPEKLKIFFEPHLQDLYQTRQFAFERSSYRWIIRADADFVAYTSGEYNILYLRDFLLNQKRSLLPKIYGVPQPNVVGDFWHTGQEANKELGCDEPGRYVPPPYFPGFMLRIYESFPGFAFRRLGRWEGIRYQKYLQNIAIQLEKPLWMHCSIKAEENYLFRSQRTNWRELGDFKKYPTLKMYLFDYILEKYGINDVQAAAKIYFDNNILPFLQNYSEAQYYPYPNIVKVAMETNPIYKIEEYSGKMKRTFIKPPPTFVESLIRNIY
jgi:glycosyltransferase involved in cell wall biosynthesis